MLAIIVGWCMCYYFVRLFNCVPALCLVLQEFYLLLLTEVLQSKY